MVVPARNEARVIAGLLRTIPAGVEVVVVDDDSDDDTAAVARAAGATVVTASARPADWTGKSWACATGAAATSRPILAFVDADVRFAPGAVERVAGLARERATLVSVQPHHVTERPYERLSALLNVVALMGVGTFALVPTRAPAGAFGPVLVLDRSRYDTAGGHRAIRGEILDDVALAREVRATGGSVEVTTGGDAVWFRMHPGGLGQLVEGWSKNIASGAGSTPRPVLVAVVAWVSGLITAGAAPLAALTGLTPWPWAVAIYACYAAQSAHLFRRVGRFGVLTAVLFPVPLVAFLGVFARSLLLTLGRGEVRWRGRTVQVRRR